jgi:DNA polymerase I-like protein with 3'-5' exonuclease and polymerase domains
MKQQRLYNGVRFPMNGPSVENVRRVDHFARPMIHAMMKRGMKVDLSHFARMEQTLMQDMDRITEEVKTVTGYYVNLDSGPQVSDLLFKKLGLKQARPKMTKSGDRESVENEVLVAIQHDHQVVPKILNFKELSKLLGTYVRPMPRAGTEGGVRALAHVPEAWRYAGPKWPVELQGAQPPSNAQPDGTWPSGM